MTLTDMVQLYAAIARGGVALPLRFTGDGAEGQRLMSAVAAWQVADILSGLPPRRGRRKTGSPTRPAPLTAIAMPGRSGLTVAMLPGSGWGGPMAPRFRGLLVVIWPRRSCFRSWAGSAAA
ncbi:hypothetical protein ACFSHQ_08235 [Gemmobacter lanyuensis]